MAMCSGIKWQALKLSQSCLKLVSKLFQSYLKVVSKLSQSYQSLLFSNPSLNLVTKLFKSCLKVASKRGDRSYDGYVLRCQEASPKAVSILSQSCLNLVSKLSQSCFKNVSKLPQSCRKVVPKLFQSCLNLVSKLFQSCLKVALQRGDRSCDGCVLRCQMICFFVSATIIPYNCHFFYTDTIFGE